MARSLARATWPVICKWGLSFFRADRLHGGDRRGSVSGGVRRVQTRSQRGCKLAWIGMAGPARKQTTRSQSQSVTHV